MFVFFFRFFFYHVWALGKFSGVPHFSMVNNCGPLLPYNSLKPFIGTLDVPVTNCSKRALISFENVKTTYSNTIVLKKLLYRGVCKLLTKIKLVRVFHKIFTWKLARICPFKNVRSGILFFYSTITNAIYIIRIVFKNYTIIWYVSLSLNKK